MPWCHSCNSEYREGVEACAECGAPLQPDPPAREEQELAYRKMTPLLQGVDELEAARVGSYLETDGIPSFRRSRGSKKQTNVLTGYWQQAVDLLVPEENLEEARRILEDLQALPEEPPSTFQVDPREQEELESLSSRRSRFAWRLAWFLIAAFVVVLLIRGFNWGV